MHYAAKSEILIEKLNEWYEDENYPPYTGDIDGVESVAVNFVGQQRWGITFDWIYKLDGEEVYVAVRDVQPATEMQDWGDYGEPSIYPVAPVEVTTIEFRRIEE